MLETLALLLLNMTYGDMVEVTDEMGVDRSALWEWAWGRMK